VAEQEAAGGVDVDGHVGLAAAQGPAAGNGGDVVAEDLGVDGVAQGKQRGELGQGGVVEAVEVGEVARLVDLVDVGLLGGELDVAADLVADGAQQRVVDELVDDGMLVGRRGGVLARVGVEDGLVEEAGAEALAGLVGGEGCGCGRVSGRPGGGTLRAASQGRRLKTRAVTYTSWTFCGRRPSRWPDSRPFSSWQLPTLN